MVFRNIYLDVYSYSENGETLIHILKCDVQQLKECTQSILVAVNGLSAKLANSFENLNARMISLDRNIKANDITASETLETLTTTTNSLKATVDQKSCQIINKTAAVFEKVKSNEQTLKSITQKSQTIHQKSEANKSVSSNNSSANQSNATKQKGEVKGQRSNTTIQNTNQTRRKQKPVRSVQTLPDTETDSEIVDLTNAPSKVINQSTLLVGSSILKGVRNHDLKMNATVRSFSGATTVTLKEKLSKYDIDNCKTIILHVGGNDADNGTDLDTFSENYQSLLDDLKPDERNVIVSGLLPRESVDLEPYNERLKLLCADYDIKFVDHFDQFLLASGELPDTYFHTDKTHLNQTGTRKLLHIIDKIFKVTGSTGPRKVLRGYSELNKPHTNRPYKPKSRYCHICSMNNHSTYECWFNGRSNGRSGNMTR